MRFGEENRVLPKLPPSTVIDFPSMGQVTWGEPLHEASAEPATEGQAVAVGMMARTDAIEF